MKRVPPDDAALAAIDIGGLDASLGFLTRLAQLHGFEHYFTTLGELDMRPGAFSALVLINRNPGLRQGLLAQRLLIKPAHMTKMIRDLEDRGYVQRDIPNQDRRAVELSLTKAGRAFLHKHEPRFLSHEQDHPNALNAEEHQELCRLLRKFNGLQREEEQ